MKFKTNLIVSLVLASVVTWLLLRKPSGGEVHSLPPLQDLNGKPFDPALMQGKVSIVSYFQTWCSDCAKEQPELQQLMDAFGPDSLVVLMVSDEDPGKIIGFKEMFASRLDFYTTSSGLKKDLGIRGFPTTFLLDTKGKVVEKRVEGIDWYTPETIALIRSLLRD